MDATDKSSNRSERLHRAAVGTGSAPPSAASSLAGLFQPQQDQPQRIPSSSASNAVPAEAPAASQLVGLFQPQQEQSRPTRPSAASASASVLSSPAQSASSAAASVPPPQAGGIPAAKPTARLSRELTVSHSNKNDREPAPNYSSIRHEPTRTDRNRNSAVQQFVPSSSSSSSPPPSVEYPASTDISDERRPNLHTPWPPSSDFPLRSTARMGNRTAPSETSSLLPSSDDRRHANGTRGHNPRSLSDLFQEEYEPKYTDSTDAHADGDASINPTSFVSKVNDAIRDFRHSQWFQPTTVAGAFMFLLYHVVFCLAMGSAIQRPSSSESILGVMAKMSAVGILFAGPLYIFRLGSDIPAIYPSIDLFLAPFLAHAAAIVDTTLVEQHRLHSDDAESYPDSQFFATFTVLVAIGMLFAGLLLQLAASFKLANLGTFLPYSVLCGFFSAVGVLLWALAFSVDTGGITWQKVFIHSRDPQLMIHSLVHHIPSLVIGIAMNRLGPKNPFAVIFLLIATQAVFYIVMWCTGTSLADAQANGWFWSSDQLVFEKDTPIGFKSWYAPPAPFGGISVLLQFNGMVNWAAIYNGLQSMASLAVLYLLRSSIHASALKKNVSNLVRRVPVRDVDPAEESLRELDDRLSKLRPASPEVAAGNGANNTAPGTRLDFDSSRVTTSIRKSIHDGYKQISMSLSDDNHGAPGMAVRSPSSVFHQRRVRRESDGAGEFDVDLADFGTRGAGTKASGSGNGGANGTGVDQPYIQEIRPTTPKKSLEDIFVEYGYCLIAVAFTGGFGCCPTVATSNTMYAIGAEGYAPQLGSVILLLAFYLTDFDVVQYIPKAAFSSLLVLGAVDTFVVWFFRSFQKTQDIWEWSVNPFIVVFSLVVGFLNAVFLGIAISTFVFVGAFFKVGSVKFAATALQVRSSIERPVFSSKWLDSNGDLIQVLVLQNYLFFGNANSVFTYIATMFDDIPEDYDDNIVSPWSSVTPKPRVLVIDLSLISGMDTSTVDTFAGIKTMCKNNDCKLYLCGMPPSLRKSFAMIGMKPETNVPRSQRSLRFFADLDTALGKAEDYLLKSENVEEEYAVLRSTTANAGLERVDELSGFLNALLQIDQQHNQSYTKGLIGLEPYTKIVELEPGDTLFETHEVRPVEASKHGLYFVESGLLKIEKNTSDTLTRSRSNLSVSYQNKGSITGVAMQSSTQTLGHMHARTGMMARQGIAAKLGANRLKHSRKFRLARIGPGWVCGTTELTAGVTTPGATIAISSCRLHHLPIENIKRLEQEQPELILRLYKMLSHLMARNQEVTIQQLATMHSIMSSPAHFKRTNRSNR